MDNKALCIMYKPEQLDDEEFYFLYGLSLREIGRRLKRHHTTIIHNSRFDTIHLSDLWALLNLPGRISQCSQGHPQLPKGKVSGKGRIVLE